MPTVPATVPPTSNPGRNDTELLSYELYAAQVLAESQRLFAARLQTSRAA